LVTGGYVPPAGSRHRILSINLPLPPGHHPGGLSDTQPYKLNVVANTGGQSLQITSIPAPDTVQLGRTYLYQIVSTDPDGGKLTYSLDSPSPTNMQVNANGLVSWTPTPAQFGIKYATVRVTDDQNDTATYGPFPINVVAQSNNQLPTITSMPAAPAIVGQRYIYQAQGNDPDGDPLQWSLATAPAGMAVDEVSGEVVWTPTIDQVGSQAVSLRVDDGQGGWATQTFTLPVDATGLPPKITSAPPVDAVINQPYSYQVVVANPQDPTLTYSLSPDSPSWLAFSSTTPGLLLGTPPSTITTPAAFSVTVEAQNSFGFATQTYDLNVVATLNQPPIIAPPNPPTGAVVGQTYS
jgi:hypothetical protein